MKTALIFSGQGSQYIGMNNIFVKNHIEIAQKFFDLSSQILRYDIEDVISNGPAEKLNNTKFTQPSIFIISAIAMLMILICAEIIGLFCFYYVDVLDF